MKKDKLIKKQIEDENPIKEEIEEEIDEQALLEKGWLRIRVIFEILGKPKEHIEQTLRDYIRSVKDNNAFKFISEEYAEAEEQEDTLWSSFAELEGYARNLQVLTWLSVNFMPASIEILEPLEINTTSKDIQEWLNDVLAKLHEVSLLTKGLMKKDKQMTMSLGTLLKNNVLLALESGDKTLDELHKKTGIRPDQINAVLEVLTKKEKVKMIEGEKYKRIFPNTQKN